MCAGGQRADRRDGEGLFQELQDHAIDLIGLLLVHEVSSALDNDFP